MPRLQTPYCPPDKELIEKAIEVFRFFLTWPEPYCSVCKDLLSTLQLEIKAPGKYRWLTGIQEPQYVVCVCVCVC